MEARNSGVIINREDMTSMTQQFRENTTPIKLSVYNFTGSTINFEQNLPGFYQTKAWFMKRCFETMTELVLL